MAAREAGRDRAPQRPGALPEDRLNVKPRRSLGQNFLADAGLRDRVVEAAGLRLDDEVLEVGAGPGTLTVALAARCRRLVAVEIDGRLVRLLRKAVAGLPNVEVLQRDVLKLDRRALFPNGGEVVVGNIPYYLTGALMPRLLEDAPRPKRLSLVVQKEVAERWVAASGASLATVAVRVFAEPSIVMLLPASAFEPRPKVDSALVRLDVRERPAVDVDDLHEFFRFVEQVFQFRRKQLRASLARVTGLPAQGVEGRLEAIGVDPTRRPETLGLADWERLFRAFTL